MITKFGRSSGKLVFLDFSHAFAISAIALGALISNAPASAATVTDSIAFSITGASGIDGTTGHGYTNASMTGSFDITFDPTVQILPSQSISGVINNLTVSVTDPYFNPPTLTFNPILYYAFDGAGTLTLSSDPALNKSLVNVPFITVGINGWAYGTGSAVWYSQDSFGDTLTGSGSATITSETPLPGALPLFGSGLGVMGLLGWRRKRKGATRPAA